MLLNIAFEKILTYKNEDIFKLVKTKTNKYYLIDLKTNQIVANTKKDILKKITMFKEA